MMTMRKHRRLAVRLNESGSLRRVSETGELVAAPEVSSPRWFACALAIEPERSFVIVDGAKIETLAWGPRGAPGLLLLPGNGAHADWWSFIAPFFAMDYRVVALSWSGMGRSDWRKSYSMALHRAELIGVVKAGGLFENPAKPRIVAHSFGSGIALQVVAGPSGDRFEQLIVVDNGARPPRETMQFADRRPWDNPGFATLEEGAARFRLRPVQTCANDFLLDFIARCSLRLKAGDGARRWIWCFDPDADTSRGSINSDGSVGLVAGARCRLDFVWGDRSVLMLPETVELTRASAPAGSRFVEIVDAAHHVMLDQPLALIAALRALLG